MAEEEAILAGWSRTTTTISRCSCSAAVRGLSRCSGRTGKEYYTNHRKRESNLYLYTAFFFVGKKSYVWEYQESGCKNLGWVDILTLQVSIYNNLKLGNIVFSFNKQSEREAIISCSH